ncbi:hypothetical protein NMY22_g14331 [Coprinellus aureogranulatus]|nr:hypothetical protein NMY22_g14331 [Coprinellus aureogranulatus]
MTVQAQSTCRFINLIIAMLLGLVHATVVAGKYTIPPPPANLTGKVILYTSNSCCGGSLGFDNIKPDECFTLGPDVDPTVHGNSIYIDGIWVDGFNAWGYASGYRAADCSESTKSFEVRYPSCFTIPMEDRARSFSWTLGTYTFFPPSYPPWPRPDVSGAGAGVVGTQKRAMSDVATGCGKADWFEYFDRRLGRTRRIEILGSDEVLGRVTSLYSAQRIVELGQLDELL